MRARIVRVCGDRSDGILDARHLLRQEAAPIIELEYSPRSIRDFRDPIEARSVVRDRGPVAISVLQRSQIAIRIIDLDTAVAERERVARLARVGERGALVCRRGKAPDILGLREEPCAAVAAPIQELLSAGKQLHMLFERRLPAIAEHSGLNPGRVAGPLAVPGAPQGDSPAEAG